MFTFPDETAHKFVYTRIACGQGRLALAALAAPHGSCMSNSGSRCRTRQVHTRCYYYHCFTRYDTCLFSWQRLCKRKSMFSKNDRVQCIPGIMHAAFLCMTESRYHRATAAKVSCPIWIMSHLVCQISLEDHLCYTLQLRLNCKYYHTMVSLILGVRSINSSIEFIIQSPSRPNNHG